MMQKITKNIKNTLFGQYGSLSITIKEGKLYKDTETFGKMDPFVVVSY